jgi:hypothetical protein
MTVDEGSMNSGASSRGGCERQRCRAGGRYANWPGQHRLSVAPAEGEIVSDAHTTKDALLPAEQIIKYHNSILPAVAHPDRCLIVKPSNEVLF